MKALSRTDQPIPWRSIELRMRRGAQPSLELTGAAASLAHERGVTGLSVSVTHSSHSAAAVVLASTGDRVMSALAEEIRRVLRDHARLPVDVDSLDDQADLFRAGMSSHASVNVMLALEDAFDIEFPDSMLKRSVFESVAGIDAAIQELQKRAA